MVEIWIIRSLFSLALALQHSGPGVGNVGIRGPNYRAVLVAPPFDTGSVLTSPHIDMWQATVVGQRTYNLVQGVSNILHWFSLNHAGSYWPSGQASEQASYYLCMFIGAPSVSAFNFEGQWIMYT